LNWLKTILGRLKTISVKLTDPFGTSGNQNKKGQTLYQRYTYRVLRTIQMKLILLCVWAESAVLGSTKTALKFKYENLIGLHTYNSIFGAGYKLEK
jgi:hypothetical protein